MAKVNKSPCVFGLGLALVVVVVVLVVVVVVVVVVVSGMFRCILSTDAPVTRFL